MLLLHQMKLRLQRGIRRSMWCLLIFRRQYNGGKKRRPKRRQFRDIGRTDPVPLMRKMQSIMGPKHVGRVRHELNNAAEELGLK